MSDWDTQEYSQERTYTLHLLDELQHGENTHQRAAVYKSPHMVDYEVLSGDKLTYNDILNLTASINIVSEFYDVNAVAFVKRGKPCGVALGRTSYDAYTKAFDCDPISAFYGVIAFSSAVDYDSAKHIDSMSVSVVVAPEFEPSALDLLKANPEIKLVKLITPLKDYKKYIDEEIKVTPFGTLIQDANRSELNKDTFKVVTKQKPSPEQIEDAIFAWKVAKHAKSNAVVIVKDFKTIAIAQGQTTSLAAVDWALNLACDEAKNAVLASDDVLPAEDSIHAAVLARIGLIIQSGGSIKDERIIQTADKYNIAMITTGIKNNKN